MNTRYFLGLGAIVLAFLTSCAEPDEAARVDLPVTVDASGMAPFSNDLGYEVELASVRLALSGLVFTVAGEVHTASLWREITNAIVPMAHAHPGHYQGGEVTGELLGSYIVDWPAEDGRVLGDATLLAGNYSAANFTFDRGSSALGDDPLVGHTAVIAGTATKNGKTVSFTFVVDSPEGRVLVGVPFEVRVGQDTAGALHFQFNPQDPLEGDTLFDAIDFEALDTDDDGELMIGPDDDAVAQTYNAFRRVFQTHDHYRIQHLE